MCDQTTSVDCICYAQSWTSHQASPTGRKLHCRLLSRIRLCTRCVSCIMKHPHTICLFDGTLHRSITLRLTRLRTAITSTFEPADTLKLNVTSRRLQIAQRSYDHHRLRLAFNNATTSSVGNGPCAAPVPSAGIAPTLCDTMFPDSHTIPIIFGTIGAILACISLVVNIAFGLLQLRAIDQRNRDQIECGRPRTSEPVSARVVSNHQTAKTITVTSVGTSLVTSLVD